jgi:hypothetical protein
VHSPARQQADPPGLILECKGSFHPRQGPGWQRTVWQQAAPGYKDTVILGHIFITDLKNRCLRD